MIVVSANASGQNNCCPLSQYSMNHVISVLAVVIIPMVADGSLAQVDYSKPEGAMLGIGLACPRRELPALHLHTAIGTIVSIFMHICSNACSKA
eukprot:9483564-Pyramimonas_sp.AAC.1